LLSIGGCFEFGGFDTTWDECDAGEVSRLNASWAGPGCVELAYCSDGTGSGTRWDYSEIECPDAGYDAGPRDTGSAGDSRAHDAADVADASHTTDAADATETADIGVDVD
jgi:hypothetical protein